MLVFSVEYSVLPLPSFLILLTASSCGKSKSALASFDIGAAGLDLDREATPHARRTCQVRRYASDLPTGQVVLSTVDSSWGFFIIWLG